MDRGRDDSRRRKGGFVIIFGKKVTRRFWVWVGIAAAAIAGLVVSLAKGWGIMAIVFAILALLSGLFASHEWKASESITRCSGMVADTVHNVIVITRNLADNGQAVAK
jgi:membrane protein implicated in regulation of membrane protease activity